MKIKTILCVGLVATSVALLSACQMKVEKTSSNPSNTPRYSYDVQEGSKDSSEDNLKSSSKKEESSSSSKASSTTSDTESKLRVAQKIYRSIL
jgi:cytoskeletal protein RodZ